MDKRQTILIFSNFIPGLSKLGVLCWDIKKGLPHVSATAPSEFMDKVVQNNKFCKSFVILHNFD